MIDIRKATFVERDDPETRSTSLTATFAAAAVNIATRQELESAGFDHAPDAVKDMLLRDLWHLAYGDLAEPVSKLRGLLGDSPQARQLCDQIHRLLQFPE